MDNLVHIGNADISIKEYKGERVVTFKDIDMVHERPDGTARKIFNDNKKHFILGEDYFVRNSDEAKGEFGVTAPNGMYLFTEQGYLMLAKSLLIKCKYRICLLNGSWHLLPPHWVAFLQIY